MPVSHSVEPLLTTASPAGDVVAAYLRSQADLLRATAPQVRSGLPDSVHRMRVTTRRLRSVLATFGPLLDQRGSDEVRAELRWLAGVLGAARDAEVLRDRLLTLAADSSWDAATLGRELEARHRTAHRQVVRALDSARHDRLLDALEALVGDSPGTSAAARPAGQLLPAMVADDWDRLARRVAAVPRAGARAEPGGPLHEVRKAAKRLRYSCEVLASVFGEEPAGLGAAAEELQDVLGELQDSVVSQRELSAIGDRAELSGDDIVVLGRLRRLEQHIAERSLAQFEVAWRAVADPRLRHWLAGPPQPPAEAGGSEEDRSTRSSPAQGRGVDTSHD